MYKFELLKEADYEGFIKKQKSNNFLQSIFMYQRYKKQNREAYLVGIRKKQKIVAAALIVKIQEIFDRKIFSAPGGGIFDYESDDFPEIFGNFTSELKKFLKKKQGSAVFLSPNIEHDPKLVRIFQANHYKELGEHIYPKWIQVLDLGKFTSSEDILKSFRQTTRQSINKSLKYGLKIRELKTNELRILEDLSENAAKKHNFESQSLKYFKEMSDSFGENLKVVAAFYKDEPISAAMFILYGDEVTYLYSGSNYEYNKYFGSFAIQHYMINFAYEHNYKIYNFYGTKPFPNDGVYIFKKGFRSETKELLGTFLLPIDYFGEVYSLSKSYQKYGNVQ